MLDENREEERQKYLRAKGVYKAKDCVKDLNDNAENERQKYVRAKTLKTYAKENSKRKHRDEILTTLVERWLDFSQS